MPFRVFYIPFCTYSKNIYNQLFANDIHFIFMSKENIFTSLIKNVFKNSNMTSSISVCQSIKNKGTNHVLKAQSSSLAIPSNLQFLLTFHLLNMPIIVLFHLCPHQLFKIWNFNIFFQKCSSTQDYTSSFHYNFQFTPFNLHRPSLCFYHCLHLCPLLYFHLHFCGQLYFHFNKVFLPCVLLHYLCFHKMLLHNFIFKRHGVIQSKVGYLICNGFFLV